MIGALLFKLMLRSSMDDLNKRNKDKIISRYADDAVIIYPGNMSVSGRRQGKEAVQEFFDKYFDQFPQEHCVARNTYIKNILALGLSNTVAIEFEKSVTNKAGEVFENRGMSVLKIRRGKVVQMQDYYFDVDKLQKMWAGVE